MWKASVIVPGATVSFLAGCMFFFCVDGKAWQTNRSTTSLPSIQTGVQSPSVNSNFPDANKRTEEDSVRVRMEESAAKARNTERFKRIQSETDKLLKLSTELKVDVDKSTKNELSLDVIRKADEIEKLAHDVKERMKG